ncbi:ADP-ribosylation factor-binding protein GGA3a isoform X2 [Takifugu flavidus]|nr:ADP-ribosylation factor-binding protein GGA3a isoform X2 [Takifugu flavidus]
MGFCDQVNKELEGPQISAKLLVHKIQSPQEWEALQSLTVLEACMKNCGRRFHNEVGKFRFLNELVKVISPKYLGDKVSERVKLKVITMLHSWTVSLPDEAKIIEAYRMLKLQGVVLADPEVPLDAALVPPPSPPSINPVFSDEKKSKRLAELLKSKKPEDLQEANRFIKTMVKEDEVRMQKASKQKNTLEAADRCVNLLNEMLAHFSPEGSTDGDKELLKELYDDCDKLRQTVIHLATESEDNDSSLGDILQASDHLSHAINSYEKIVDRKMERTPQKRARKGPSCTQSSDILIDLLDVDVQSVSQTQQQTPASSTSPPTDLWGLSATEPHLSGHSAPSAAPSLLDDEPLSLRFLDIPAARNPAHVNQSNHIPTSQALPASNQDVDLLDLSSSVPACSSPLLFADVHAGPPVPPPQLFSSPGVSHTTSASLNQILQDLDLLDLGSSTAITTTPLPLIRDTQAASTAPSAKTHEDFCTLLHPTATSNLPLIQPTSFSGQETSLSDVFVPLSDIKPSQMRPVMACDRNGIRFLLHFATDCPAGRPDVLVIVASILSTAPLPVRDVVLQAAVPKMMKVRLQQPSGRELAPFNPIHPPAAITQVMLLANPLKVKVRLRYKLTFTLGAQSCTEVGEVNEFPTADTLGALPDNSESPKTGFEGGCQGQRLVLMNDNTWNCNH